MNSDLLLTVVGVLFLAVPAAAQPGPEYGGKYTKQRIANLRTNVASYDWAKAESDKAVAAARRWVELSDDELWAMIPGQNLPRCIDTTMTSAAGGNPPVNLHVCPVCGDKLMKFGNYSYGVDIWNNPWKLVCPSCQAVFPKNDFGKYYRSGIDETGCFNPEQADKSLLFNAEHPDPSDPLHKYGVDDGWGWTDDQGIEYRFIGYYGWQLWREIKRGLTALATAYLYTGDPRYAHKAGIMLDRIGDVYPDMDWSAYGKLGWYHSDGGRKDGKIEGAIWEADGTIGLFASAYDMIKSGLYDQPELYVFLAKQAEQYALPTPKGSYQQLVANIETNVIEAGVKAIHNPKKARCNEGGYQSAIIKCAMALNRMPKSEEWIDWCFHEGRMGDSNGGHIPALIVGSIDRDGVGAEGSPGYSLGWAAALGRAADDLAEYAAYTKHDIYRDFPQFKQTITAGWRLGVLAAFTPNIGDCGSCGSRSLICASPEFLVRGYRYLKDPQLALMAVRASKGRYQGLGRDIFAEDPDWIEKAIARIAEQHGTVAEIAGENLSGYGLVSVEFGPPNTGHGLWMYYGRNFGHGHRDRLNFGLSAFGFSLSPDLGYPEFCTGAWPKLRQWTDHTISHNTVLVNETGQSSNWVGHPQFFAQFPDFGGFCVDSPEVYPDIATVYSRTMAMMKVGPGQAYCLDVFRVAGGQDHLMSFHGPPGEVVSESLSLINQEGGSYAGPEVEWQDSPWKGPRTGYAWLNNVERDRQPGPGFMLDYAAQPGYRALQAEDDVHLRYHCLTQYDDVALADGYPPSNKAGAPEKLRYLLGHRAGDDGLASTCVALLEPYQREPLIKQVTRLAVTPAPSEPAADQPPSGLDAVAVRIELADGMVDYLLNAPDEATTYRAADGISFCGRLIALRTRDGIVEQAWLIRSSRVEMGDFTVTLPAAGYRGTIVKMDKDMQGHGHIWVDTPLPTDDTLRGAEIIIQNDRQRNAVYTIEAIEQDGELYRIDCGEVCFIREFVDRADYSKGYLYNFDAGAEWMIPHRVYVERRRDNVVVADTTSQAELVVSQP